VNRLVPKEENGDATKHLGAFYREAGVKTGGTGKGAGKWARGVVYCKFFLTVTIPFIAIEVLQGKGRTY
jgi:hypothetical protein